MGARTRVRVSPSALASQARRGARVLRAPRLCLRQDAEELPQAASRTGAMTLTRDELLRFMSTQRLAVQSSVSAAGAPQAAVVGIAVSDQFGIIFDTLASTRKVPNLRANPRIAFVIGGLTDGDERTVQYEGVADE